MACPDIKGLKFSPNSRKALVNIKRARGLADALASVMAAGVFMNIFVRNSVLTSSDNIRTTDWKKWSQAMAAIPDTLRAEIRKIAGEAAVDNPFGAENKFWSAIADGCRD